MPQNLHDFQEWEVSGLISPTLQYMSEALRVAMRHPTNVVELVRRISHNPRGYISMLKGLRTDREVMRHVVSMDEFTLSLTDRLPDGPAPQMSRYRDREVLYYIVRNLKPRLVVETGIGGGYSSRSILLALRDNGCGRLISIDVDNYVPQYYDEPRGSPVGHSVESDLRDGWVVLLSGSEIALPQIAGMDLFLHDSDHTYRHMMFEYETAWERLNAGGLLLTHDVGAAFVDFTRRVGRDFWCWNKFGGIRKV